MPDEQKRRAGGPDGLRTEHRPSTPQKQAGNGTLPAAAQPAESATIDLVELMYRLLGSWKLIAGIAAGVVIIALIIVFVLYKKKMNRIKYEE